MSQMHHKHNSLLSRSLQCIAVLARIIRQLSLRALLLQGSHYLVHVFILLIAAQKDTWHIQGVQGSRYIVLCISAFLCSSAQLFDLFIQPRIDRSMPFQASNQRQTVTSDLVAGLDMLVQQIL